MHRSGWKGAFVVAAAGALVVTSSPAYAHGGKDGSGNDHRTRETVRVVAEGLNGPRQLSGDRGAFYVAESDIGQVTKVDKHGDTRALFTGFPEGLLQGVTRVGKTFVMAVGEAGPDEGGEPAPESAPPAGGLQPSALYVAKKGGEPQLLADLLAYELANNPDGQLQFDETGAPVDALSNPYYVVEDKRRGGFVLVADAGANAVLAVDRKGNVSEFFVPPLVTTGACEGAENNSPETVGCDPVPTGLAYGRGNTLYVSTLSAEVPGEGRIYVLNARTGKVKDVIGGLNGPTGVAVDRHRNVYVSELLEGAPQEEPGPGFDPSGVGQIVKIDRRGNRTFAQVTMPTGLLYTGGNLYASAWSIASFLGIPDAGQIVKVTDRAFTN